MIVFGTGNAVTDKLLTIFPEQECVTDLIFLAVVLRSVVRLPCSASSPGVLGRPLPAEVLEGQYLHLVVPEGGLVVVLLGGGIRVHRVGYL